MNGFTKVLAAASVLFLLCAGLAACGSGNPDTSGEGASAKVQDATLVLDYLPNGLHAGIYEAKADGYYEDEGINLKIIQPTSTADTLKLILAGKADFGLADGVDLAEQMDLGRPAKGIMAVLERPAGGLITLASSGIKSPKDLAGKKVGITGVPSDNVVFDQIVSDDGGNPDDSDLVTIGFNGVQSLKAGKISAFTGFVPADATAVESTGQKTKSFLLDEYGGPSYPGLVAFSTEDRIKDDPDLMQGFVDATIRGYQDAISDPKKAIDALVSQTDGTDPGLATKTFKAYEPLMGSAEGFGQFDDRNLKELSTFLLDGGLIKNPIPPSRYATKQFTAVGG